MRACSASLCYMSKCASLKLFQTFPCWIHPSHLKGLTEGWWAIFMMVFDLKINVRFIIVLNTKQCTLQSLISVLWVLQRNKTLSYLFQHLLQKTSIMHKNIWKSVILAIRDKNWHRTGKPYKVIMLKWTD